MQGDNGQMTLEEQIALLDKCRWILEGADKSNDDELTKISMLDELDDVLAKLQAIAVGKLADRLECCSWKAATDVSVGPQRGTEESRGD